MKLLRLCIFLIVCMQFATTEAGLLDKLLNPFSKQIKGTDQPVKILIAHDKPTVMIEVKGKYRLYDPNKNSFFGTRFLGKRRVVEALNGGIKWGEEFPGIYQILIVPDNEKTITIVDGIEYQGPLYIYDIGGTISVVNVMDADEYLKLALPRDQADIAGIPEEALAALVIAARTDAMYRILNPKSPYWNIDATQLSTDKEIVTAPKALVKVIDRTHNMIISATDMPMDIKPIPARWGANGTTQTSKLGANVSRISFEEAIEMAKKGSHAAQILGKAFPNTRVELMR